MLDVNEIFRDLSAMVSEQGEIVGKRYYKLIPSFVNKEQSWK